jgi:hypothetical protein
MLEGAGNTLHDLIGGNDGTINGAEWEKGDLALNGSTDYVNVGPILTDLSYTVFVDMVVDAFDGGDFFSEANSGNDTPFIQMQAVNADYSDGLGTINRFHIASRDASDLKRFQATRVNLTAGRRYRVVVTSVGGAASGEHVYVNGIEQALTVRQDEGISFPTTNTGHIGKLERTSSSNYLNGLIRELRIWNYPMLPSACLNVSHDQWAPTRPI